MKISKFLTAAASILISVCAYAGKTVEPDGTYLFAEKDGESLYLDVYEPAKGSATSLDGKQKPTILYVFGGGFKGGHRDSKAILPWFAEMTAEGYRVVSIDYRLGLKDAREVGLKQAALIYDAIQMAVEDLFSATLYIIDNAAQLGIDPSNIVVSGSSAGAITSLQAEWEICNGGTAAGVLPKGFNYAGVMAFAGAVYSKQGGIRYATKPAPTLLFHGKCDDIVKYGQIWFFKQRFAGSDVLVKALSKADANYNIYRFGGKKHEIASSMVRNLPEELRFLETNVVLGQKRIVDADVINDPEIEPFRNLSLKKLYGNGAIPE